MAGVIQRAMIVDGQRLALEQLRAVVIDGEAGMRLERAGDIAAAGEAGLVGHVAMRHREEQRDIFGHRPVQRVHRLGGRARREAAGRGAVPDLLRNHARAVFRGRHIRQEGIGAAACLDGIDAALAGEDRPEPTHAGPVIVRAVGMLAIAIVVVAIPVSDCR